MRTRPASSTPQRPTRRSPTGPPAGPLRRAADGLALALSFLTVAPVPVRAQADPRWAPAWFPLVGALIGALAGAVRYALDAPLGAGPASVLAVATLAVATGALHLDGLADCADALGVRRGRHPHAADLDARARRLAVMREPQVGVFAVLAVVLWAALVVSTLARLERDEALAALVLAAALGRWSALLQAVLAAPARADGLGAAFAVPAAPLAAASSAALAVAFAVEPPVRAASAMLATALATALVTAWARRWLGGRTGDTLGAGVALAEATVLVVVLAFVGAG